MSMMTWVGLLPNTVMAPPVPAGTLAALALIRPSMEFRVDTGGCGCPEGQTERNPSGPSGTTVRFSEYASALAGMLQALAGILKSRGVAAGRFGPPKAPTGFRVSAPRAGV